MQVTPSFFPLLRVSPRLGRAFTEEEGTVGNDRKVILSHALWVEQFAADPEVMGRDLRLDGELHQVVGVMPHGFYFPRAGTSSIWTTIADVLTAVGDSVSEALARIVGAPREKRDPQKSVAFTIGVIALSAKMAKADGVVTSAEIAAFKEIFAVRPDELSNVARVFNLARTDVAGYELYAHKIANLEAFVAHPDIARHLWQAPRRHASDARYTLAVMRPSGRWRLWLRARLLGR